MVEGCREAHLVLPERYSWAAGALGASSRALQWGHTAVSLVGKVGQTHSDLAPFGIKQTGTRARAEHSTTA